MTSADVRELRDQIADLTAALLRLEAAIEILRRHLVSLGQRTTALETDTLTPPPRTL